MQVTIMHYFYCHYDNKNNAPSHIILKGTSKVSTISGQIINMISGNKFAATFSISAKTLVWQHFLHFLQHQYNGNSTDLTVRTLQQQIKCMQRKVTGNTIYLPFLTINKATRNWHRYSCLDNISWMFSFPATEKPYENILQSLSCAVCLEKLQQNSVPQIKFSNGRVQYEQQIEN